MKHAPIWLGVILLPALANAAPLTLECQPVQGATEYVFYMSVDLGKQWAEVGKVATPSVRIEAPDQGLVIFRVASVIDGLTYLQSGSGAWYNADWDGRPRKLRLD